MKRTMRSLKENRKKGFTLVELIVVLVILAILAALLVPALTGYIDKAKEKQVVAETRLCVMAAQTLADEVYAKEGKIENTSVDAEFLADVQKLAETPKAPTTIKFGDKGKVTELVYENELTCKYTYENNKGTYAPQ